MFNEDEDWNDEGEAQILSKTVSANQKSRSSEHVKVYSILERKLLHVQISCLFEDVYLHYTHTNKVYCL